jgi:RNA polymerase sigma factor (sigma-70 family)
MRAMGNILVETLQINRKEGVVISKFHRLQTNPSSGKTYRHTYQRNGKDVNRMFTRMPNLDRWEAYEKQKDEFMVKLYKNLKAKALKKEEKEMKDKRILEPVVKDLSAEELHIHYLYNVKHMKQKEIASEMGWTQGRISQILKEINEKSTTDKENG